MKRAFLFITAIILAAALIVPASAVGPVVPNPDAAASRSVVIDALYRREGSPALAERSDFPDTAGQWYADAASWARTNGIVLGDEDGSFRGSRGISRAELAVILYRYAVYKDIDVSEGEDTNILSYSDAFDLPSWSYPAFQWAVTVPLWEAGESLLPDSTLTCAELTDTLVNFTHGTALAHWTQDAQAKKALTDYVTAVTDPDAAAYIPVKDRIAVFDLDGTLFCETDPNYFDYTLLAYRVLEDPDYKDKASDFEREVANKIREQNETGASFSGLEVDHGRAVASAFAGMTVDEFNAYIQEFKKQDMPSYDGMKRGGGFYRPMVEVVEYLQRNGFTVYVVSGTDRLIVRGILYDSVLDIPNRQIIGSDEIIVSSNQGDTDGLNYVFTEGDELILGGEFLIKNLKMNKVSVIMQEIGQQPVLSFGNSTGDSSMAEYVTSGNPYPSLAFMLCCDDLERENGNEAKAQKMFDLCAEFDWVPISMKNDWTTIYGDGVTKK
ncbi:MAG: haloacid dehalogenase-like hydrolase [Clostridia bacterium]|nr:haloacid dehalogenase-like hydrolase [Clostridia bacterium]